MERAGRHRTGSKAHARKSMEHRPSGRRAPPRTRHPRQPTYTHVRVEIDLGHEIIAPTRLPFLAEIRALLKERNVEEEGSLLDLAAALLHALQACGFSRVDHWEIDPGGWLPLPEEVHPGLIEPVGHLLKALASERWRELATAYAISFRLSGEGDHRADVVLRRLHREREHSLSLDLFGRMQSFDVHRTVNAVRENLTVLRAQVTESAVT
ncbi:MAG: hypothetical protein ACLQD8_02305 [Thermoplasmata archaeon]